MLDVIGLRYHPATAAAPVLRDVSLQLSVGAPALVAADESAFLEFSQATRMGVY